MSQALWLLGLLVSITTAIGGQAELIGEPWRHYVAVAGIILTAIAGYMLQHPWNGQNRRQQE